MKKNLLILLLIILILLILLILTIYFVAFKNLNKNEEIKIKFQGPPPGSLPYVKGPSVPPPYFQPGH